MKIIQLEVSNIRFGKIGDNSRTPSQNIAFITYADDTTRLNVITPEQSRRPTEFPARGPTTRQTNREPYSKCPIATSSRSTTTRSTTQR